MIGQAELVGVIDELKPLPVTAQHIVRMLGQEEWQVDELVDAIRLDPVLTGKVLRASNSAAEGSRHKIDLIPTAATRLGAGSLLSLTVSCGVMEAMNEPIPSYGLQSGELWQHSVATACAAELAGRVCEARIPPSSYTAALLHDIGKLLIAKVLDSETLTFMNRAEREGQQPLFKAESEIMDVHHGELGGVCAQHWQLPEAVAKGIIHHHDPDVGNDPICDVVHLADAVAKTAISEGNFEGDVLAGPRERLKLKDGGFDRLCELVADRFSDVMSKYS